MSLAQLVVLLVVLPAGPNTLTGRVVGDTITFLDATKTHQKIRLAAIDAPEKGQAFGERSKQNLSRLVYGKDVRVDWRKHDRYGRLVGRVWVVSPDTPCCDKARDPADPPRVSSHD